MHKFIIVLIALGLTISCNDPVADQRKKTDKKTAMDYVDPNIGTAHSRWFFYTPAAVPFGMAKLGPSTNGSYGNASGWEAVGYDPRHTTVCVGCGHQFCWVDHCFCISGRD